MKHILILVGPIALGVGLVAVVRTTERGTAAVQDAPAATAAPTTAPAVVSAAGAVAPPIAAKPAPAPDRSRELGLPDGSFVPALNDAIDAAPLQDFWGPQPFSPIVGVERSSAGLDWYRHADGSYSTTQMVWRKDLDRMAAMTRVAHPGPAPAATAH